MKTTNNNYAKIAKEKSILKEFSNSKFSRIVYLDDKDEFQIQIFNPEKHTIGVQISLNDVGMSNMLVLKPGERVWLERYLDTVKKFKFSTYKIDGSEEAQNATEYNGLVKVSFYKEITKRPDIVVRPLSGQIIYGSPNFNISTSTWLNTDLNSSITADLNGSITNAVSSAAATMDCCTTALYNCKNTLNDVVYETTSSLAPFNSKPIETGRIEEGSNSNQKFEYVNNEFQSYPFRTETIKIMPKSTKPISVNDLQKIYCYQCGRKLKTKYKYCPYCGAKQ